MTDTRAVNDDGTAMVSHQTLDHGQPDAKSSVLAINSRRTLREEIEYPRDIAPSIPIPRSTTRTRTLSASDVT